MNRKMRFVWAATLVLLLAAAFRLVALHDVPPGLAQDEVLDAGMPAFILQGNHALFFREGYGHEPLYHYWSIPFYLTLGRNVLAARLPSVVLGLLLVALTMRWAKREFGAVTAVAAGLGLAVSWWPIIFSRVGIRPIAEPVVLLLMAWFWPRRPWLAGLFLGLSVYTYTGARVVFLIPVLLALYGWLMGRRGRASGPSLKTAGIVLLTAVLVAAPMFVTLWLDPTLQQRVGQLAGPLDALRQGDLGPVWDSTWRTLGVFSFTGDPRWTYTWPGRPLFDGLTAVFFYAGLVVALWRIKQPTYAFALIWLAVGLIPSAITPQAPSTVRLVGAMPVVYVLVGLAVSGAWRVTRHRPPAARYLLLALLALLLAGNIARTVRDGFVRWPKAQETRLNHYQSVWLDVARYLAVEPDGFLVVADAFYEPIDRDTLRYNLGYDPAARWVQRGALVLPAAGNGRAIVPEFAPVAPELLALTGVSPTPAYRSEGRPSFGVYTLPSSDDLPALAEPVSFGGLLTLRGYTLLSGEGERPFKLATIWQVEKTLPPDLTAFVHLLDSDGRLLAQHDGLDAAPAELQPGDIVVQLHVIPVGEVGGPLTVQTGLYTAGDGRRLTPAGLPGDVVILQQGLFIDGK